MEVKAGGRRFQRAATRQAGDLNRALVRRTKVKVSSLLSPESQKAMLMVKEETVNNNRPARRDNLTSLTADSPTSPDELASASDERRQQDDVNNNEVDHVGFGAMLDKVCTTRLPGDITDKTVTSTQSKKRTLRSGDRLNTAMEVVEIVRYDGDEATKGKERHSDTDDEMEARQRAAAVSSHQRCRAWLELHFDADDTKNQTCSGDR